MTVRDFLDAAIKAADRLGTFDPAVVARQLKLTRGQQRQMGSDLDAMKLVAVVGGKWQLLGVAGELAHAVNGRTNDPGARRA